jgi:hypothetical protein
MKVLIRRASIGMAGVAGEAGTVGRAASISRNNHPRPHS